MWQNENIIEHKVSRDKLNGKDHSEFNEVTTQNATLQVT